MLLKNEIDIRLLIFSIKLKKTRDNDYKKLNLQTQLKSLSKN
jgi:hypothetical protein